MTKVTVIGVDGRALPGWAGDRLAEATLVLGAGRHLEALPVPGAAERVVLGDVDTAVAAARAHDGAVVVLASGDPGFFGIVRVLREAGLDVEVCPAVSSVSAAFALAGLSWDDAVVVSAHGRQLRRAVNVCRALAKVAVLTGPGSGPAPIGAALGDWPRRLVVAEQIATAPQRLSECTPQQAAVRQWAEPNVVLVVGAAASTRSWVWPSRQPPTRWALPEQRFAHRDGMVTKAEVRAVALAQLGPGLGDLVWDVGSGSGAVGVECARFGAAVVAVDRNPEQCDRVRRNAAAHAVDVQVLCGQAPACLAGLPAPDAVFVGGGGLPAVTEAARRDPRAVVAALAAVDRVAATRDVLRAAGYEVGGVELAAGRFTDLPDGSTRLAATNPVFLVWGQR